MQENENGVDDPSQLSASCQDNSPSVFPHSSKLRKKLEKLAQWRIDPSLIKFPPDAREFSGGFAKVVRGLLASPSQVEEDTNTSEHVTAVHSSEAGNLQSGTDPQEPESNHQSKDDGADGGPVHGDNDHEDGEGRNNNDEEQEPHDRSSIPRTGDGLGASEQIGDDDPDLDNLNPHFQSGTQESHDGEQGRDEETKLHEADHDNDQTADEARKASDGTNEEHYSDHRPSKPKIVAVKKLKIESDTDLERVLGLALRESEILTQVSHPNIVKLEGFVEDLPGYKVWLLFPWEQHGNLRDFLASGDWEIPERISLIHDVMLGLAYLHSRDPPIYHGDLKSLNILVGSEYRALITDFGSARHIENDRVGKRPRATEDSDEQRPAIDPSTAEECITLEASFSATASTLTLTGSSYTLRWAAPELLQDDRPCLRSDIWSLGWIAYEVMTNTIPFHDIKKDAVVINRVVQGHLPSVTEDARMSLIRALCSLMVQCWNMNPSKRPTAGECRKLIFWLPMIVPAPTQSINEEVSSTRYAHLLNQLGRMYKRQGDYLNAFSCFTKASNIYTVNNDSTGKARNLCSLAHLHLFWGEHVEAASFYTEALQIYTESGDQIESASAILGLAEVRRSQQDYKEAKRLYSECLQIFSGIGLRRFRASSLFGLAAVHQSQSEYSEAETLYSESLETFTDLGDRLGRGTVLWSLGEVHRLRDEYIEAETLYSEALEIFTEIGDRKNRGNALWSLGGVHRLRGEYSEASERYLGALEICTEIGDRQGRGTALWGLAEVHAYRGEYGDAIKFSLEAKEIFIDIGNKYWKAEALLSLARFHQTQAHHSEAISYYEEASKDLEETGDPGRAADALKYAVEIRKTLDEGVGGSTESVKVGEDPLLNLG